MLTIAGGIVLGVIALWVLRVGGALLFEWLSAPSRRELEARAEAERKRQAEREASAAAERQARADEEARWARITEHTAEINRRVYGDSPPRAG